MHRFFVSPDCIKGNGVTLSGDAARQLARVLRARPGDQIIVLDSSGWEYRVTLTRVDAALAAGTVTGREASQGEPRVRVTLYQGVLKADKLELVLQKCTELGVAAFVPVFCARSVPRDREGQWAASRYPRWRKIIAEAAEQSRRGLLPSLEAPLDFKDACHAFRGLGLVPWEEEHATGLRAALARWRKGNADDGAISVFIGPEGGFTREEVDCARARGIVPVSLGRRILRAETAGIAAVAAIMYELGELGG